jgi:hypothetical protein
MFDGVGQHHLGVVFRDQSGHQAFRGVLKTQRSCRFVHNASRINVALLYAAFSSKETLTLALS